MASLISLIWNSYLYTPILNLLVFLYYHLGNSFGWSIIALTLIVKGVFAPLSVSSLKSQKKLQELQPKIAELKKKHKDKKEFQMAQLELYKSHGVTPGAGCLPQILQVIVILALYRVFLNFINTGMIDGQTVAMRFLWFDLSKPDPIFVLPILAGLSQLIYSLMLRPGTEHPHPGESLKTKDDVKQEKNEMDMAQEIQSQMTFLMPVMTTIIALKFPSGLALYWVISTVFSVIQQWALTGPGGLTYYTRLMISKLYTAGILRNHG